MGDTTFITFCIIIGASILFLIIGLYLFISDDDKAKKEGRKKNWKVTVLFIISMIPFGSLVTFLVLIIVLGSLGIWSM